MCVCVNVICWSLAGGIDTAEDAYSSGTPGLDNGMILLSSQLGG